MEASSKNHYEIVQELLAAGADASLSNDVRCRLTFIAVHSYWLTNQYVLFFFIPCPSQEGITALSLARKKGNREIIALLSRSLADCTCSSMPLSSPRQGVFAGLVDHLFNNFFGGPSRP